MAKEQKNRLKKDSHMRKRIVDNIREYKKEMPWPQTLKPVKEYIEKPYKLQDKYDEHNVLLRNNIRQNKEIIFNLEPLF